MRRRSLFLFVARDHFGFDAHRIADHAVHHIRRVRQDALRLAAHQPEQIGVGDHAMFDDFEQAGAVFALRQRVQHGRIDNHRQRLMKAADQVLAGGQVHAGFAAHGSVHLRQQRGWHLNHGNAAHEDGGQESGHVGENAAAECNDDAGAVCAARDHLLRQRLHFRQALARFAAGEKQDLGFAKSRRQRSAVQLPNVFGRNQKHLAGALRNVLAHVREPAAFHQHRVTAMRRLDEIRRHTIVVPCEELTYRYCITSMNWR